MISFRKLHRVLQFVILSFLLASILAVRHAEDPIYTIVAFNAAPARVPSSHEIGNVEKSNDGDICDSLLGHLPSAPRDPQANAWNQMKWIGEPAKCRVKGQLIESLDEANNFRRGFALQFVNAVEDKSHLLPWLYGSRVDLNARERRVYLDLGANKFHTSLQWFMQMYPCDFTEVHAFEANDDIFQIPNQGADENANWIQTDENNDSAVRVTMVPGVSDWMLKRVKAHNSFVADFDDIESKAINITRFMKDELKLTASDAVVVKMDIEGAEWPILTRWLQDSTMAEIIDELFVEIHYHHPSMAAYHWTKFPHTREDATQLLAGLRSKGYFVHAWP